MTKPLLIIAALVASGPLAHAEDSFESRAQGAVRIANLSDLAWALTATCDAGDEVQQRQCRHLRDTRVKQLAGATLLVDAQPGAFEVGAWSPAKKSVPLSVTACIDCAGVAVNGKTYYLTGAGGQVMMEGGQLRTARLLDTTRTFTDEATAKAWLKMIGAVRIQMLVKIPDKVRWQIAGRDGLGLEILGYRVYVPCEGTIVVASPTSGNVEADKKACPKPSK